MKIRSSIRGFTLASALAGSLALLGGCTQQAPGEGLALADASQALTTAQVLPTGGVCSPTGAHAKHAGVTNCAACHDCGGVLQFSATGPAVAAGQPLPTFDAVNKTCASVACHSVPAGVYTYVVWDYSIDEGYPVSVPYGGGAAQTTPSWYTTGGSACAACHPLPANNYNWHSGYHGGTAAYNACSLCHVDAVGSTAPGGVVTGAALSTATNCGTGRNEPCAKFHADGVLTVTPQWGNGCFGCH